MAHLIPQTQSLITSHRRGMLTLMTTDPRASLIPTAIAVVIACIGCDRSPAGKILDDKYAVVVRGDGDSYFTDQYIAASKLIAQGKIAEAERLYAELAQNEPDS